VLDEARLDPLEYAALRTRALIHVLALELARDSGGEVGDFTIQVEVDSLRRGLGLHTPRQMDDWLVEQGLSRESFADLVVDRAKARRITAIYAGQIDGAIADLLRLSGLQGGLEERARDKQEALALRGLENPTSRAAGITDDELWRWYFETRLGSSVPHDLEAEASSLDYLDVHAMRRTVLREYCYLRIVPDSDQSGAP
ncbi:MAG: hypothetical protein WBM46_15775, partial [Polyangiales bacterium]